MANSLEIDPQDFSGCFGCGTANPKGLGLRFRIDGDAVFATTRVAREYAGYEEFVHGGIVATILDDAMGWAMLHLAGRYGVTRSLDIRYRRPVLVGKPVTVKATIASDDGRALELHAELSDELGRVLATAVADWRVVRQDRARSKPVAAEGQGSRS